jgi:hypothetical protein
MYVLEGRPKYDALLLDVGGTLLETAKPVPEVYAEFGEKYGNFCYKSVFFEFTANTCHLGNCNEGDCLTGITAFGNGQGSGAYL